ncbi:hypothetical protein BGX30_008784 [Mortierella sp. GBA39]|nr:hypothetical protein BGX30_008784 [Mortierella sp. GBA39]
MTFDRAVHVVNISNMTSQGINDVSVSSTGSSDRVVFSAEEQLLLYGAYKQATKGDVKGLKPTSFFDIAARSKWQTWANMRGKTQDEAKAVYVDLVVKQSLTKPDNHPDHYMLADEIIQRPPSPPPSLSRTASPATTTTSNLDKDLPPIQFEPTSSTSKQSSTKDTQHPYQHQRKGSVSHSIRSVATGGIHSAAASVYELASEQPFDTEADTTPAINTKTTTTTTTDSTNQPSYHDITETLVEEEILDDDEYANEIQKVTKASPTFSQSPNSPFGQQQQHGKDDTDADNEEEEDDVYQSSVEYDDDDDRGSSLGTARTSTEIQPTTVTTTRQQQQGHQVKGDDFVDEGVFDEEEKDELDAVVDDSSRFKLEAPAPVAEFDEKHAAPLPPLSNGFQLVGAGQDKPLGSPVVEPYRVNVALETPSTPQSVPPTTASPHVHAGAGEEAVCPVSKKTASSGGVCPAAMFAQARAAAAGTSAKTDEGASEPQQSAHSSPEPVPTITAEQAEPLDNTTQHHRAATEPPSAAPAPSSSSTSSAVTAATNQGKRIGQGIVSRFTALRSSLAAASARAASSALSGGSSSSSLTLKNKNAVVVKDPITNQSVTIVCPHLETTQVLETEVVRMQTEISVLHERLDLLQESLKIKSQTRAQERRSARGILKLVLRQGLINAVLLLIVFAVLYKRKSPIAFAILAYVGQGAKEGEAGWRALMRWSADVVRTSQRNQTLMLRAGRRNGYW